MSADMQTLAISGARCAGCVASIERALRAVPGVTRAEMNFADRSAQVEGGVDAGVLIDAVRAAGYDAEPLDNSRDDADAAREAAEQAHYRRLLRDCALGLALGVPLMAWGLAGGDMMVMPGTASQWAWGAVGALTLALLVVCGGHFFVGAWRALRQHNATMDTLIALGTGAAWLYSMVVVMAPQWLPEATRHVYFEASAMIIGLLNLGLALEIRARGKTSQAIRRLLDLRPQMALMVRDGHDSELPVAQLRRGDLLRARPGDRIAVDGVVETGDSYVDESMLSGEPMPVRKGSGDRVSAGTLNQNGALLYRADKIGRDTALARIIELVRKAQGSKPPIGRLADAISAVFVPAVLIIAVVAALVWYNLGPQPALAHMLVAATTVLIIACPCALGLATPLSTMVGVGKAAEFGALIRRGDALQNASALDTIVLDKTGTITEGKPAVTAIAPVHGSEETLLQLAAALERQSEHPLATAIVNAAAERQLPLPEVAAFRAHNGQGVEGVIDGRRIVIGNRRWLQQLGIELAPLQASMQQIETAAGTPLLVAAEGVALGVIGIADRVRSDSRAAIERLQRDGIRVVMLTGDVEASARAIAAQVGIDTVIAEVLPEQKAQQVEQLQAAGNKVGMVGDGINDAPALAAADVGFAIGGGTDVAIESADIALMRSSLHGVADAIEISRATLRNIRQNLFGAFIYNALGIPIAAGLLYPLFGWLLSPVIAGAAMSLSSVTVVANANRLRLLRSGAVRSARA